MIAHAQTIAEILEEFLNLIKSLSISDADLKNLSYETITTEETTITKHRGSLKVYSYTQIKGYKNGKSYTLKSWREGQAPTRELSELIRLYRACRHIKRALEYL